jgi:gliding motility associated protien GldN
MKKLITFTILFILITVLINPLVQAQEIKQMEKQEVYDRQHIPTKNPIPYPFIREADVSWEKTIWRMVNLREKMNLPLYFPTQPIGDRKSLVKLMVDVLQNPEPEHIVYAYSPKLNSYDYEFTQPMNTKDIQTAFKLEATTEPVRDSITGQIKQVVTGYTMQLGNVTRLIIKEKWFFDRRYSTMNVRILGLCPVRVEERIIQDPNTGEQQKTGEIAQTPLFWIYYPEIRYYLSRNFTFNPRNDAQPVSFDDLFMQRHFSSYILRESNVYDNRNILDYAPTGLDPMFEAERIKQSIAVWEHDLWEY